jgi:drug/metabolite transporter (DMT)-like permease
MAPRLPLRVGIPILLAASTMFASNHVAARIAFDHGASVAAGVVARATGTALVMLLLMRLQGVALKLPRELRVAAVFSGLLHAVQSYCLYSAVAVIPAALALLVFHTAPMLFVLLSWAMGKEHARASALAAMALALAGLALALNLPGAGFAERWAAIGIGVSWAFAGALSFMLVLYLNANALKVLDGRMRNLIMTAITAVTVLAGAAAAGTLAAPADAQGWLGLLLLTVFYCGAMCALFIILPRVAAASTVALNFEPIALLGLGWIFLGQAVVPLQIVGAFLTVGAIAWLGFAKR